MGLSQKPLLFIDTNIFLDFYRAETEASLSLLRHIESISEALITTDQVEKEFLNNRQRVISTALQSLKAPSLPPFIPAYLAESRAASRIEKDLNDIKRQITLLKKRFARILKNPASHDPVFKVVKKVMSVRSPKNFKFQEETKRERIFERALRRFQRGLPPRKRDDTSIGDALNWEWITECAIEFSLDVVIVSRDGDFGLRSDGIHYLNDSLQEEFKERVSSKRKVEFTTSLAQALRRLAVPVTEAEENEERKIIAQRVTRLNEPPKPWPSEPRPPSARPMKDIWDDVLNRVGQKSPFARNYLIEAIPESLQDRVFTVGYEPDFHEYIDLVNNKRVHDLVQSALKEIGLDCQQVRFVCLPAQSPSVAVTSQVTEPSDDEVPF